MRSKLLGLVVILGASWAMLQASESNSPPAGVDAPPVSAGERFYRAGLGISGKAVPAMVQGDLAVVSNSMPCANCHKRSGWGTVEGPVTTPPVVGPVLFDRVTLGNVQMGIRTTGPGTRPAYDDASLARAIRDGIDPAGRRLSPTMPRYDIGPRDLVALITYLRALGASPAPGVTATTLHLATITTPGVDGRKREVMLSVMRAFVDAKNAGSRNETRRRDNGPWDMKSHYELYRQWELHEWTLTGSPARWPAQLAAHYASQPVFALVGGLGDSDWTPIHRFCEAEGIPCVLPQAPLPPVGAGAGGFYSTYYSSGLTLEAETLAQFAGTIRHGAHQPGIRQIARCGTTGQLAARVLAERLGAGSAESSCVDGAAPLQADQWRSLLSGSPPTVVAWIEPGDLVGLDQLASGEGALDGIARLVLSATLVGDGLGRLSSSVRSKAYLVDPFVAPDAFDRHAMRSLIWLKSRGLAEADRAVAVNTFFAVSLAADALGTPRAIESREYFVEQLEHMVGRSPLRSAYPALSLGPGRRFASLGCAVLKVPLEPDGTFATVVPWSVPDVK
jgi:hypothetical protein